MRGTFTVFLAAMLVICIALPAGAVALTSLTSCQPLDVEYEVYEITSPISNTTNCFRINADHITLRGKNQSITGDNDGKDSAILMYGRNNITIINLNTVNYSRGVSAVNSTRINVSNSDFSSGGTDYYVGWGLNLTNVNHSVFNDIDSTDMIGDGWDSNGSGEYGGGIYMERCNSNVLVDTYNYGNYENDVSIYLGRGNNNTLNDTESYYTDGWGIYINGNNNTVNTVYINLTYAGIEVAGENNSINGVEAYSSTEGVLISNNWNNLTDITTASNSNHGILVNGNNNLVDTTDLNDNIGIEVQGTNNTLVDTYAAGCTEEGIVISGGSGNTLLRPVSTLNTVGILVSGSDNNNITGAYTHSNTVSGMSIEGGSTGNRVNHSRSNNNTLYGLHIQSSANFVHNLSTSSNVAGVAFESAYNNNVSALYSDDSNNGVVFIDSNGNTVRDSTITGSTVHVNKTSGGDDSMLNTTYDGPESVAAGGILRRWYLTARVQDSLGRKVDGATVGMSGSGGSYTGSQLTDFLGNATLLPIQYNATSSGNQHFNNYTITATYQFTGDSAPSQEVNMSMNRVLGFIISISRSFQVILSLNQTSNTIFVPGSSPFQSSTSPASSYSSLAHWHVSSYLNDVLYSLIFAGNDADRIWVERNNESWCEGADTNSDGLVESHDLSEYIIHAGSSPCYLENNWCDFTDMNRDGAVNDLDSDILVRHWGGSCWLMGHRLTLSQGMQGSKAMLAFTRGGRENVVDRVDMIEKGSFFDLPSPSFGAGLGVASVVKVLLEFSDIDFTDDLVLQRGSHELVVENTGRSGSTKLVNVRQA